MHVAKGVEDSDLAMSKDMVFYTLSEKNGVISLVTAEKYSAKKQTMPWRKVMVLLHIYTHTIMLNLKEKKRPRGLLKVSEWHSLD